MDPTQFDDTQQREQQEQWTNDHQDETYASAPAADGEFRQQQEVSEQHQRHEQEQVRQQEEAEVDAFAGLIEDEDRGIHDAPDHSQNPAAALGGQTFTPYITSTASSSGLQSSPHSSSIASRIQALHAMTSTLPNSSPMRLDHISHAQPASSPTPVPRFPRAFVPLSTPLTAGPHSPIASTRSSPNGTVGIDASFFRSQSHPLQSQLRPDRLAIGSPEAIIENTFRYQMAQQIEQQRRRIGGGGDVAASGSVAPASLSASTSRLPPAALSASSTARPAPASSVDSLRSQLKQLRSSPGSSPERNGHAAGYGGENSTANAIPLASQFDHAASRGNLYLSHLQASPSPTQRKGASDPSQPSSTVSALHGQLSEFNSGMSAFQQALLEHRQRLEEERTVAIGNMEESVGTLEESLKLEETNCTSSLSAMQQYTESVMESWQAGYSDAWANELHELERIEERLQQRVRELEEEQVASEDARRREFAEKIDHPASTALAEIHEKYQEGEADAMPLTSSMNRSAALASLPSASLYNHRALLKLDQLENKMRHLVVQTHRSLAEHARRMEEDLRGLREGREMVAQQVEQDIVQEVMEVRSELHEATGTRVECDQELQNAFQYATKQLLGGLQCLRR
jgi:hypothetical protein